MIKGILDLDMYWLCLMIDAGCYNGTIDHDSFVCGQEPLCRVCVGYQVVDLLMNI
jgi:hypothetical protein